MENDAEGGSCFATRRLGCDGVVVGDDGEFAVDGVWVYLESMRFVTWENGMLTVAPV